MNPCRDTETVDDHNGIVIRRITVGPLRTNCWAVHSTASADAVLIDPGDAATSILTAVDDLHITAIVLTHTHWDHLLAVPEIHDALGAPIAAHPADIPVWRHEQAHLAAHGRWDAGTATDELVRAGCTLKPPDGWTPWDGTVHHGLDRVRVITSGPMQLTVLHTPGHTPGGVSLSTPGHVFTGDTLFPGGPGLTGWPFSDFDTIVKSIRDPLLRLPAHTIVHPGHGEATTIGNEAPHLEEWVTRGS